MESFGISGAKPSGSVNAKVITVYTGQFKKKITLSHVYNEVTCEHTITRYTTIIRKTLKLCL
jgi:hypothetical protein